MGGRAQRTLLAALLLQANEPVSVDRLVEAVWGDSPPATADHAVEVNVSNLRNALGAEAIERRPGGYALSVALDRLDLARFEDLVAQAREELHAGSPASAADLLREALALWRGPALADFAFDEFAQAAIARLEELRLTALKARIDADLELGRHEDLVPELGTLAAEHPYDEKVSELLMLALYRSGRQADALAAYRELEQRLREELGLEPSPALRALQRRILAHDASLEPDVHPIRSVVVVPASGEQLDELTRLAEPLGRSRHRHEVILALLEDPGPPDTAGRALAAASEGLARVQAALGERGVEARTVAFTAADRAKDVLRLAGRAEVDLLVLGVDAGEFDSGRLDPETKQILTAAPCDIAVWLTRDGARRSARDGPILVPFGALEHDWAALELGAWLAGADQRELVLLGATADSHGDRRDASRMLADASLLIQRAAGVPARGELVEPGRRGLVEAAAGGGLLVIGLSERWAKEGLGAMRWDVTQSVTTPVILVKRGLRPGGIAPPENLTRYRWSVTVGTR